MNGVLENAIDKIVKSASLKEDMISKTKLDVFKCCHMVMETVFAFKIHLTRTYGQIV